MAITRDQVLRFRFHRHGLASGPDTGADTPMLDYGVQDTGPDGGRWALAIRGVDLDEAEPLLYAWTLRGAPHAYRRADAADIAVATSPFSEADAAKRIFDASKPLRDADIPILDALRRVAGHERDLVVKPKVKGEVSGGLTLLLDPPYLRFCRPCNATHVYEQPFRLSALQAGIELEPGTSPPVMRRIPKLKPPMFTRSGTEAEPRFDVVRNYLRFHGPAIVKDAATFVDAAVKDVKAAWPDDAVEVEVEGETRWALADDIEELNDPPPAEGVVRLVGPFDPFLQTRDRKLLVSDTARQKVLWPTLGRPGAVLVDGDVAATWRPRRAGKKLNVAIEPWSRMTKSRLADVETEVERLASFRGAALGSIEVAKG